MICAYFGTPSRIIAARSAGVPVSGSVPALSNASRVSAAAMSDTISLFRRSMIGCGVPAGAMIASHSEASNPG